MVKSKSRLVSACLLFAMLALPALAKENNGNRYQKYKGKWVKKAIVTTVVGNTITATKGTNTYTIDASAARVIRRNDARASVMEIRANDIIDVKGTITAVVETPGTFNVVAKLIKNRSIVKMNKNYKGVITSIDAEAQTFVFTSRKIGTKTVDPADNTVFKDETTDTTTLITFANLQVGDTVLVKKGVIDTTNNLVSLPKEIIRTQLAGQVAD